MKFSIVIPVYYNEPNLADTIPRLLALRDKTPHELELVFVDDGSKDRSLEILLKYQEMYPKNILVVKLTRNFGSMAAIQAGFMKAGGDFVGVISADLQDPPELFIEMIKKWEKGIKAVFAVRNERVDPQFSKFLSDAYYSLFRRLAVPGYPKGGFDFVLVDRQIVDEVNRIHEKNTNLMTLIYWMGYEYVTIPYTRKERVRGTSRWTLGKKIKLALDSFLAFSYFPIRLLSLLGVIFAFSAFIYGVVVLYTWWLGKIPIQGWTALMVILTFTAGIQMIMLGVLGEYLWRILDQSGRRPMYVVERVFGSS